jgi:hypothetical protein
VRKSWSGAKADLGEAPPLRDRPACVGAGLRDIRSVRPGGASMVNGVGERVEQFVRSIRVENLNPRMSEGASGIRFADSLFSWGEVGHEAIFDEC